MEKDDPTQNLCKPRYEKIWPRGYISFSNCSCTKLAQICGSFRFKSPKPVIYSDVKMPKLLAFLTFMSRIKFMLS